MLVCKELPQVCTSSLIGRFMVAGFPVSVYIQRTSSYDIFEQWVGDILIMLIWKSYTWPLGLGVWMNSLTG